MTAKQQAARQSEIDTTTKMLQSTLDFIRRFPNDAYVAKRQAQAEQMKRRLAELTA